MDLVVELPRVSNSTVSREFRGAQHTRQDGKTDSTESLFTARCTQNENTTVHTPPPSFVGRLNSIWTKQRRRLQRDRVHCHQPPPPSRDRVESPGDDVHATVSQIKVQNLQHRSSVAPLLQSRGESAANRRRFCCCHYSRVLCLLRAEEILFS